MRPLFSLILLGVFLTSCVKHKEVTYFNDLDNTTSGSLNIPEAPVVRLQPNDVIEISISSISKDANEYFQKGGSEIDKKYAGNTYLIALDGSIDLPLVGKTVIGGMTNQEAEALIKEALLTYLQKPSVNIRLVSFEITVLGEVKMPGVYSIADGRVTVLEALGYAGDLTIFGKRNNILVIRNSEEGKSYFRIDLNSSDVMNSDKFYLQNNDVVYVEPSKGLTSRDDNAYRILPLVLSTLTFVAVIIGLSR